MTIEGKTKILEPLFDGCPIALVTNKDDLTAGDGAKHDVMTGKAAFATRTTCNIFDLLHSEAIPLAYVGRDGPVTFLTRICDMIPVEVVVRGIATGSYLKRNPSAQEGTHFENPVVELFLKTTGRMWQGNALPCDDPLMVRLVGTNEWGLHEPGKPVTLPFDSVAHIPVGNTNKTVTLEQLEECENIARNTFECLAEAWDNIGGVLYDFKLEFGVLPNGEIVVADVIDCDSWRVRWDELQLSKQGYRDGDDLDRVLSVYRIAAALSEQL